MELSALTAATADIEHIRRNAVCLYDAQAVEAAIAGMAKQIARELADSDPLLLCVMNGGLILTGRLAPLLDFPL